MRNSILIMLLSILGSLSCQVKPMDINYGEDGCHFCKMTIVDKQHAAQIVTTKGKNFKYDAIECMMNHLRAWDQAKPAFYLVNDYESPGKMVDAQQSYYLISKELPSPMGEYLTAFEKMEDRNNIQSAIGGQSLNWVELKDEFEVSEE